MPCNNESSSSIGTSTQSKHVCSYCSGILLRHVCNNRLYWRCSYCYQEVPALKRQRPPEYDVETASSGSVDPTQESDWSAHSSPLLYSKSTQAVNILVVDNDPDFLYVWEVLFQSHGARVIACRSVKDALASLDKCVPDILISEVKLSDETVSPLIEQAKHIAIDNDRETHVIVISTYVFADFVRCFYDLTADVSAYFCKPINITELVNTILKLLRENDKSEHHIITNALE